MEETKQTTVQEEMTEETAAAEEMQAETAEETEAMTPEAEEKQKEMEALENRLKRLQADFDNFRKRTQSEKEQLSLVVKIEVIKNLLPVLDTFQLALKKKDGLTQEMESFLNGFEMIYNQLFQALEKEGLKEIEAVGKEFDPNYHEAIMRIDSDEYEEGFIAGELQKGYMVGDRTIRPSMVQVVNKG